MNYFCIIAVERFSKHAFSRFEEKKTVQQQSLNMFFYDNFFFTYNLKLIISTKSKYIFKIKLQ